MITDDQRRQTAETSKRYADILQQQQQRPLRDDIIWMHQPAFDKAFADITGTQPEDDEWRRETRWNFTADDGSFT